MHWGKRTKRGPVGTAKGIMRPASGRRFPAGRALAAALLVLASSIAGCSNDESPTASGPVAQLIVFFEPNPAPNTDYGEFKSTIYVGELSGVGVHIYQALREGYSPAGQKYQDEVKDEHWFKVEFLHCGGGGTNYIPGGSARCRSTRFFDFRNQAYEDWTFLGVDDFGNEVTATGRLFMGEVPPMANLRVE